MINNDFLAELTYLCNKYGVTKELIGDERIQQVILTADEDFVYEQTDFDLLDRLSVL